MVSLTPQRVLPNRYPLHCWPMFSSATSQPPSAAVPQRSCCQRACCPAHPHHAGQQHTDSCSGPADLQSWPPSTDCSPRADRRTQPPRTQPYIKCTAAMIQAPALLHLHDPIVSCAPRPPSTVISTTHHSQLPYHGHSMASHPAVYALTHVHQPGPGVRPNLVPAAFP